MPRLPKRRKAQNDAHNNNNNDYDFGETRAPKRKRTVAFHQPPPTAFRVRGQALVCGTGDMGQLGLGEDRTELRRPALVESVKNVVDVQAGGMHSLLLTADGRLYSFGCNDEGALGRDSSEDGGEFIPREVQLPGKVVRISAGDSHSACLLSSGEVYAWGSFRDSHGNMGLTLEGNKNLPINILPDHMCCDIASGTDHLVILTSAGKVHTIGCGEQGQLGRVSMRNASGESRRGKRDLLRPGLVSVKRARPIEAIWATNCCTFLRESQKNTIWAFGLNNCCQLTFGEPDSDNLVTIPTITEMENIQQIAGGLHHTIALKNDKTCHVVGRRDYGRLGLGSLEEDVSVLKPIKSLENKQIVSVSCGDAQSFALTDDGKLYAWGMGSNLQLGTGSEDDAFEPTLIASKQTINKRIIRAAGGGQHSIFLVEDDIQPEEQEEEEEEVQEQQDNIQEEAQVVVEVKKQNKKEPASGASLLAESEVKPEGPETEQETEEHQSKAEVKKKNQPATLAITKKAAAAAAAKEKEAKRAAEGAGTIDEKPVVANASAVTTISTDDNGEKRETSSTDQTDQDNASVLPEIKRKKAMTPSSETSSISSKGGSSKRSRKK